MESSLASRNWDAAGLNAVHSAISAADALLVYHAGIRSAGESHQDAAALLKQYIKDEQTSAKAQNLSKILSFKNISAYEDRELTEAEAGDLAKLSRRFLDWAESLIA